MPPPKSVCPDTNHPQLAIDVIMVRASVIRIRLRVLENDVMLATVKVFWDTSADVLKVVARVLVAITVTCRLHKLAATSKLMVFASLAQT